MPPEPSRGILAVTLPNTPSCVPRPMFQVFSTSVVLEMVTVLLTVWHSRDTHGLRWVLEDFGIVQGIDDIRDVLGVCVTVNTQHLVLFVP